MASSSISSTMTSEQQAAHDAAVDSEDTIFISGGGGTGKTYTTKMIKEKLSIKWKDPKGVKVRVVTPQWLAAVAFDEFAVTHHHIFSIGDYYTGGKKIGDSNKGKMMTDLQVLIFDEISMGSGSRLDLIDFLMRLVRKDERPFGGVKVIYVGDF